MNAKAYPNPEHPPKEKRGEGLRERAGIRAIGRSAGNCQIIVSNRILKCILVDIAFRECDDSQRMGGLREEEAKLRVRGRGNTVRRNETRISRRDP